MWWEMGSNLLYIGSYDMNARAGAQNGFVKMDLVSSDSGNYSDE